MDESAEMTSGDVEGINLKVRPLLERHKDAGVIVTPAVVINVELQFLGVVPAKAETPVEPDVFLSAGDRQCESETWCTE